MSITTSL